MTRKKALQSFFELHILGIMAHFSEVLSSPHTNRHILEKRRCVGAIGEMIEQASSYVTLALPQVRLLLMLCCPSG
jgi:serine/threonine-protein kinase ATR